MGRVLDVLSYQAKVGYTGKLNYIADSVNADIIIMGSSRGAQHYVTDVFEDSLQMSCFNCSRNGNGIILMYGRYRLLRERYNPKIIIYDVNPHYDIMKNDNSAYITDLRPFNKKSYIDSILCSIDSNEKYKLLSHLYQYNYRFLEVVNDYIHSSKQFNLEHQEIITDTIKHVPPKTNEVLLDTNKIDSLKLFYLEKLILDTNNKTDLIFVSSPRLMQVGKDNYLEPLKDLCKKHHIPFYDYNMLEDFSDNQNYWHDSVHMNYFGAINFSEKIVKDIINAKSHN